MNETQRRTNLARRLTHVLAVLAARPRRKDSRPNAKARRAVAVLLGLALLVPLFAPVGVKTQAARQQAEIEIEGTATQPVASATVNFADMAAQDSDKGLLAPLGAAAAQIEPPPAPPEPESEMKPAPALPALKSQTRAPKSAAVPVVKSAETVGASASAAQTEPVTASAVGDESRAPASNFLAQSDAGTHAPPDASGGVGLDTVLSTHRSNYVVQDKETGAVLSSVSAESFWASTGASGVYNPRALYVPTYDGRWLLTAASNARSAASSVLVAFSQTSDPQGAFDLYRFDADPNDQLWADYVSVGFNMYWVALTFNAHNISNDAFSQGVVLALSHWHLLNSTAVPTRFAGITTTLGGFSMQPAVTYAEVGPGGVGFNETDEYFVSHIGSGAATYRVSRLTGTGANPTFFIGTQKVNSLGGWTQPGGETLPQAPGAMGLGTRKIEAPDSRVQKAVFRNGGIYYCQTVGLPAGRTAATIDRTAAQWVQVNTSGDFVQGGRIEDPTATPTNGGKWYAYPSLSVNRLGYVFVGFTQFASNQFASAGYALRVFNDPAGTTRLPRVYKAGEGHYERALPGARNLWGLYSDTQVDPSNDLDLWTIQEYAAAPSGVGPGSGRWATRWAEVITPSPDRVAFVSNRDGNDEIYTMESDGSHVRRLTFNPAQDTSPTWSPDRTRIAFTRYGPTGAPNSAQIYVVNADGSNETFLTQGKEPAWSPDPDYIAFVRGMDIWTHRVSDGWEQNVTNNEAEDGYYGIWRFYGYCADSAPSWSPDGQTLVFAGQNEDLTYIFTINPWIPAGRTERRTELMRSYTGIGDPAWSPDGPDGQRIAYVDAGRICTMSTEGDEGPCTTAYYRDYAPSWSPDGSKLLFYTNRTGNLEVFTMHPDLIDPVNLTNSPASNEHTPGG